MGNIFDRVFQLIFAVMRLAAYYILMVFMGGVVLGFAPATLTFFELYQDYKLDNEWKMKDIFTRFWQNFLPANRAYLFLGIGIALLSYSIFIALQIRQFLFFIVVIVNLILLVYLCLVYIYYLFLSSHYQFNLKTGLKLAAIVPFMKPLNVFKLVLGSAIAYLVLSKGTLLLLPIIIAIWHMFVYDISFPLIDVIDQRQETGD